MGLAVTKKMSIKWNETADIASPYSYSVVDFSLDPTWIVSTMASRFDRPTYARYASINNTGNAATVYISYGVAKFPIPPFTQQTLPIPPGFTEITLTGQVGACAVVMFVKEDLSGGLVQSLYDSISSAGATKDQYFSNVSLLLQADKNDDAIIEKSRFTRQLTNYGVSLTSSLVWSDKKDMIFNGSSYIDMPLTGLFDNQINDFTFEYVESNVTNSSVAQIFSSGGVLNEAWPGLSVIRTSGNIETTSGSDTSTRGLTSAPQGAKHHYVWQQKTVQENGNTVTYWSWGVDGKITSILNIGSYRLGGFSSNTTIGRVWGRLDVNAPNFLIGAVAAIRFTKGIGRYSHVLNADFPNATVTGAFPTS